MAWNIRIRKDCHAAQPWHGLHEQLQLFPAKLRVNTGGESRDVSSRPCKAGHEPDSDGIGVSRHDDGDRRRCAPGCLGCGYTARHDHVDRESGQLRREDGKPLGAIPVLLAFDDQVPTLDVAEFTEAFSEHLPMGSHCPAGRCRENRDARYLLRRLRLRGQPCGKQAEGTHQPCAPIHGLATATVRRCSRRFNERVECASQQFSHTCVATLVQRRMQHCLDANE